MTLHHKTISGQRWKITQYSANDPEPDVEEVSTAGGQWTRGQHGWQHEWLDGLAFTWRELLDIFDYAYNWEKE